MKLLKCGNLISGGVALLLGIALLLTVFPFALILPAVPTNQIPSAFFLLLGVWFCASPDTDALRFWRWLPAGLSLAVGNILRPDGVHSNGASRILEEIQVASRADIHTASAGWWPSDTCAATYGAS